MKNEYEHIIKIMLVGDSGVGKTAIMNMFCDGKYSDRTTTTVGIEYKDKTIRINNKKCLIQLWDTAETIKKKRHFKQEDKNHCKNL